MTFRLPIPVKVTDIRVFPEKWTRMPYISLDFDTCDLYNGSSVRPETSRGRWQRHIVLNNIGLLYCIH